ncbi:MAG: PAS domain-containing protein [Candidatus Omnitrophota bacterium]
MDLFKKTREELLRKIEGLSENLRGLLEKEVWSGSDEEKYELLEKYRLLFENTVDAIMVFDLETLSCEDANPSALRLFGYSREEFTALRLENISDKEERLKMAVRKSIESGKKSHRFPVQGFMTKDGRHFYGEMVIGEFKSAGRQKVICSVRDITERKEAVEKIKEISWYNELLFNVTPSATFTVDKDRCIKSWNRKAEEITGYSAEEIVGKACMTFSEEPCNEWCGFYPEGELKPVTGKECIIRRKDGRERIISKNVDFLKDEEGKIIGGIESFEDITERKKAEDALKEEKIFTETSLNTLRDIFYTIDTEGRFLRWNKAFRLVTGYTDYEIAGMKAFDFFTEEAVGQVSEMMKKVWEEGSASVQTEIIARNGKKVSYEFTGAVLKGPDGKPIGLCGVGRDVAERKRMEDTLRESEAKYRTIFENTGTAMVLIDEKMTIIMMNAEFEKLSGHTKEEIEGRKDISIFLQGEHESKARTYHEQRMFFPDNTPRHYELTMTRKNGEMRDIYLTVAVITGTKLTVVSMMDITESNERKALLDKTNRDLQWKIEEVEAALSHIKRLEGLVPICANCKKMMAKDSNPKDPGSWIPLEQYISERSEASFTHGLCPDCIKRMYGEIQSE